MLTDKKIIIATHQMLYGASQALRDYLIKKKVENILFIGHPFVMQRKSSCTLYRKGIQVKEIVINRTQHFGLLDYIVDFFQTIWWVYGQKETYDIFVGVDGLNCLAGLFFKKIGKVKKVIFYSIDFSPIRFENKFLNMIYHKIETTCLYLSDESWNVSPRIAQGREEFLQISSKKYKQKVVPIGIWNNQIKKIPFDKIKKHQLLFVGHLLEKQGVQKVLEAIPLVVKKIPDFRFLIIGGGEYHDALEKLVTSLDIKEYVEFQGWVKDRKVLNAVMSQSACAVATYMPEKEKLYNFTYYADPTKLKEYLGAGLPIILTDVPYNAREIEQRRCGIITRYKKEDIASAILTLLDNGKKLKEYRENSFIYAREFDWQKAFGKALR